MAMDARGMIKSREWNEGRSGRQHDVYVCINGQTVTGQTRVEAGAWYTRRLCTVHIVEQSTAKVSTR